jgi:ABC-2 type transport system permease protein
MKRLSVTHHRSLVLLRQLVKVGFKRRYEDSLLGMFWSALKPLLLFAIMYVVFVRFLRFGQGIPHFAVSLLLAIVFWDFFSETTSVGMRSIVDNGHLLRKINLPSYTIVVSASVSALINFGINLVVVLIFALISGVVLTWSALLLIPLIIECFIFSISLSLILSTLYVKFRDIGYIWDVFLQGAYFATPIIYPISMIIGMSEKGAKLLMMSPMAQIIQDARWGLVSSDTETVWGLVSNPFIMLVPLAIVIALSVFAVWYFRRNAKHFAEMV